MTVAAEKEISLDSELQIKDLMANPDAIASYLSKAFENNDHSAVIQALQRVLRAQNVQAIARASGIRRENLYKTFDGKVDPRLGRVMALASAVGVSLTVKALPRHKIPGPTELQSSEESNSGLVTNVPQTSAQQSD